MTAFIFCCGFFRVNDFASSEKFTKIKYVFVNTLEIPRFFTRKPNLIQNVRIKNRYRKKPLLFRKSRKTIDNEFPYDNKLEQKQNNQTCFVARMYC